MADEEASAKAFALAIMFFNEQMATLAAAVAGHRDRLIKEHGFSTESAEAMATHFHMQMVQTMCASAVQNRQ